MNAIDRQRYEALATELERINDELVPLPGIHNANRRDALINQIIDSIRRIDFIYSINKRDISTTRCDPLNDQFDPIRAAIFTYREGNFDEAIWLIFLSTHFGKNLKHGWLITREIYGGLGVNRWTWEQICSNLHEFSGWINSNYLSIRGAFGNHRKYESVRPDAQRNLVDIFASYIEWVGPEHSHQVLFNNVDKNCDSDPRAMFSYLYKSLSEVLSFGRTAKFDFLSMLAKTGMVNIIPDSAYLRGATGPLTGARLLLTGSGSTTVQASKLEEALKVIYNNLSIGVMGMQVLEDSLCNWQKNPSRFIRFRG